MAAKIRSSDYLCCGMVIVGEDDGHGYPGETDDAARVLSRARPASTTG